MQADKGKVKKRKKKRERRERGERDDLPNLFANVPPRINELRRETTEWAMGGGMRGRRRDASALITSVATSANYLIIRPRSNPDRPP